jgi:hypothetical protein
LLQCSEFAVPEQTYHLKLEVLCWNTAFLCLVLLPGLHLCLRLGISAAAVVIIVCCITLPIIWHEPDTVHTTQPGQRHAVCISIAGICSSNKRFGIKSVTQYAAAACCQASCMVLDMKRILAPVYISHTICILV